MKEIGGFLEFEKNYGDLLHDDGLKLNCGRSCLEYIIDKKSIKKLLVPYFMCSGIFNLLKKKKS